jgi:hypothetical protein
MIRFLILDLSAHPGMLGYIPSFLSLEDPRPAKEQFASNYIGGWHPYTGFTLRGLSLHFLGDPPMRPLFASILRDELIFVYDHGWVMILQQDNSFEVSRMD